MTSRSVSGAALVAVAWMIPWRSLVEPDELGDDPGELLDPVTPDEQEDDVADGLAEIREDAIGRLEPLVERQGRVGEDVHQLAVRRAAAACSSSRRHVSIEPSRVASWKAASA